MKTIDDQEEYKKVDAELSFEVLCHCPYCSSLEDVFYYVRETLGETNRASGINVEVKCTECTKVFIVENVFF